MPSQILPNGRVIHQRNGRWHTQEMLELSNLMPLDGKRPYYPGVIFLSTDNPMTPIALKVYVVERCTRNPNNHEPDEMVVWGVYLDRDKAEEFISKQAIADVYWAIEELSVSDYPPYQEQNILNVTPST